MREERYEKVVTESSRSAVLNYIDAMRICVETANGYAKRALGGMSGGKGVSAVEHAIVKLREASGSLDEAEREVEG